MHNSVGNTQWKALPLGSTPVNGHDSPSIYPSSFKRPPPRCRLYTLEPLWFHIPEVKGKGSTHLVKTTCPWRTDWTLFPACLILWVPEIAASVLFLPTAWANSEALESTCTGKICPFCGSPIVWLHNTAGLALSSSASHGTAARRSLSPMMQTGTGGWWTFHFSSPSLLPFSFFPSLCPSLSSCFLGEHPWGSCIPASSANWWPPASSVFPEGEFLVKWSSGTPLFFGKHGA